MLGLKLVPKKGRLWVSKSGKGALFVDRQGNIYTAAIEDVQDLGRRTVSVDLALLVDDSREFEETRRGKVHKLTTEG